MNKRNWMWRGVMGLGLLVMVGTILTSWSGCAGPKAKAPAPAVDLGPGPCQIGPVTDGAGR